MRKTITATTSVILLWATAALLGVRVAHPVAQQPFSIMPQGMIVHNTDGACPIGWAEYTAARGRYVLGLSASGTVTSAVGIALTNLENREAGQHTHALASNSHTHTITDPGHVHGGVATSSSVAVDVASFTAIYISNLTNVTSFATTGITIGNGATGLAVSNSTAPNNVAGTNAPYAEYILCKKS